jgi:flagellar motor switch protein FliM
MESTETTDTTAPLEPMADAPIAEASGLPITPDAPVAAPDSAEPFRFSAASFLSAARQESLEAWHRPFLRIASASLRSALRLDVELEMESVQVQTCAQFAGERDEHNQGALFRMSPQPDLWLLDLPLSIAILAVERMMGAAGTKVAEAGKARELSELEQIIFQQFASSLLADYARNWQPHADYTPEIVRSARHVRLPRAIGHQPDDLVVRVTLRVAIKESKSLLTLLVPIAAADELLRAIGASEDHVAKEAPSAAMPNHKSPIGSVPVAVSIRWEGFKISLREVEALQPGDLLVLDPKTCEQGVVWLGDRARFNGKVAREAHRTVVTLSSPVTK